MQLAVAPATYPTPYPALTQALTHAGATAPFFAAHAADEEVRGDLVRGGGVFMVAARPALLLLAALILTSCSQLGEAYAVYDTHVDREIVAGHDEARGNYAEVRFSPRWKSEDGKAVSR